MTLINLNKTEKKTIDFEKKGRYTVFFYNLSGNFIFNIKSSGVDLNIYGLFVGKGETKFDVRTTQRHIAPGSRSNILIKGVFYNKSKFIYEGLIRIEKEAQKSHAYQKNMNLILSKESFVDTRPFLEILANDVFCTHGSTTGKLNTDEIYYLASRGIKKSEAKKMLIKGFIQEILTKKNE